MKYIFSKLSELLSNSKATFSKLGEQISFDKEKHHEIAKKCALESIVLLKNNEKLLPLSKDNKVSFIGDFFKNSRYQGAGSSVVNPTMLDNVIDLIPNYDMNYLGYSKGYNRYGKKNNRLAKKALKLANKSDIIVYAARSFPRYLLQLQRR